MKTTSWRTAVAGLLAAAALAACGTAAAGPAPRTVRPGAPGEPTRPVEAGAASERPTSPHTEADVRFMQDMIVHHRQALEMSALAPERSERADVRLLARRIEIAQKDEIALMARWLEERGESVPGADPHHAHHADMPGMLSPQELARLAATRGAEFDRLFLQSMIRHHEGALVMVDELFARAGAGQEGEIFQLAADIAGDQRIEIARMLRMLAAP